VDGIYKSTDAGVTWQAENTGLPSNGYVTALAIDPLNPSTLYASVGLVFKSTDAGATWAAMNPGLSASVNTLAIDPLTPSTLYAGTGQGVFSIQQLAVSCVGDCDTNGRVAINELILGVNIVLNFRPDTACPAFANSEGMVDIAQLITGVNEALNGCGA
jgi:hypothetical protein